MLTILTVDLIPNGLWAGYPYLIGGALTNRLRDAVAEQRARDKAQAFADPFSGGCLHAGVIGAA
jgi:hypothetical protein